MKTATVPQPGDIYSNPQGDILDVQVVSLKFDSPDGEPYVEVVGAKCTFAAPGAAAPPVPALVRFRLDGANEEGYSFVRTPQAGQRAGLAATP